MQTCFSQTNTENSLMEKNVDRTGKKNQNVNVAVSHRSGKFYTGECYSFFSSIIVFSYVTFTLFSHLLIAGKVK